MTTGMHFIKEKGLPKMVRKVIISTCIWNCMKHTRAALKVLPRVLLCWPMKVGVGGGGMAAGSEPSHQYCFFAVQQRAAEWQPENVRLLVATMLKKRVM